MPIREGIARPFLAVGLGIGASTALAIGASSSTEAPITEHVQSIDYEGPIGLMNHQAQAAERLGSELTTSSVELELIIPTTNETVLNDTAGTIGSVATRPVASAESTTTTTTPNPVIEPLEESEFTLPPPPETVPATMPPTLPPPPPTPAPTLPPETEPEPEPEPEESSYEISNYDTWLALAECESGGDWSINTGNGFYGGLQFTYGSWVEAGGQEFAERADLASMEHQMIVAERLLDMQGWGAWPACSAQLGLS